MSDTVVTRKNEGGLPAPALVAIANPDHMRPWRERWNASDKRLIFALACYAGLAMIVTVCLDGILRVLMWAFFALLALKSLHAPRMDE